MKYNISNSRLKTLVDELGEEYKDLLIEHILNATEEVDTDYINASDLMQLDIKIKSNLKRDRRQQLINRLSASLSQVGSLYTLLGSIFLLWIIAKTEQSPTMNLELTLSLTAIFVGLFAQLISSPFRTVFNTLLTKDSRRTNRNISPFEVVNKWKEIEALIHQLTPEENTLSLSSMLFNLADTKIITYEELKTINRLRRYRNKIVHEDYDGITDPSQADLRSILAEINELKSKMQKFL